MEGVARTIPRGVGWEVSGKTDKRYLVESGQIVKFRGSIEMGENDDLDRLYFG